MNSFKPHINVEYPKHNVQIFEEWLSENYSECHTDRVLLPVWFTSYWVCHNYGNDLRRKQEMQEFIDSLDRSVKYFCVTQYDDSVLIDFKDLDVLRFEMSKNIGIEMPLLCQPHPFKFKSEQKWLANFVGSKTHPLREQAQQLKYLSHYYISYEPHDIEMYCRILHESVFTLCFRGYGFNSFRIAEAMQYGSIPVYISDTFIKPFDADFEKYGVLIEAKDAGRIDDILHNISPIEIIQKQDAIPHYYNEYYTYEGARKQIIKHLETEYYSRQQVGTIAPVGEGIRNAVD